MAPDDVSRIAATHLLTRGEVWPPVRARAHVPGIPLVEPVSHTFEPGGRRPPFRQWLRATWIGWITGIPLIVLFALLGEMLGTGGVQAVVGMGMGLGVGAMQGGVLGRVISRWRWTLVTTVGLTLPLLTADIAALVGRPTQFRLYLAVAAGGALAGLCQAVITGRRSPGPFLLWTAASVAGWTLAAGMAYLADSLPRTAPLLGITGAFAYLGITALGGLLLGAVTGLALGSLVNAAPVAASGRTATS